jgi:hypothetical protein
MSNANTKGVAGLSSRTPLFLGVLVWCLFVFAATASSQTNSIRQSGKQQLKLELKTSSTRPCLESSLPLELAITNLSDKAIRVFKGGLWNHFAYTHIASDGHEEKSFVIEDVALPEDVATNAKYWSTLQPTETLTDTFGFSLKDEFFGVPGRYKLGTSYNQSKSNLIEFEIIDCHQK